MGDALATWFEAKTCVAGSVQEHARRRDRPHTRLALAELCYRTLLADGAAALHAVADAGRDPGARATGRGEHAALGPGLRVVRPGRGPRRAQRPDRAHRRPTPTSTARRSPSACWSSSSSKASPARDRRRGAGFATEVGLPITLAEIGLAELPQDLLEPIARRATAQGETIHNEPFEVTPDMVADAILAADAVGRAWKNQAS